MSIFPQSKPRQRPTAKNRQPKHQAKLNNLDGMLRAVKRVTVLEREHEILRFDQAIRHDPIIASGHLRAVPRPIALD
jgi:hypothetical protein